MENLLVKIEELIAIEMDDVSDDEQVDKETEYTFYITLNCKKNLP